MMEHVFKVDKRVSVQKRIDNVFEKNKDFIVSKFQKLDKLDKEMAAKKRVRYRPDTDYKARFKSLVTARMEEGSSMQEALDQVSASVTFTDFSYRAKYNLRAGLKTIGKLNEFYEAIGLKMDKNGRLHTKSGAYAKDIDWNELNYEGDDVYSYQDTYIVFKRSPEEVFIMSKPEYMGLYM